MYKQGHYDKPVLTMYIILGDTNSARATIVGYFQTLKYSYTLQVAWQLPVMKEAI